MRHIGRASWGFLPPAHRIAPAACTAARLAGKRAAFAGCVLAVVTAGCSGGSGGSGAADGGGRPVVASGSGSGSGAGGAGVQGQNGDTGAACNSLMNGAPVVNYTASTDAPPSAMGGTIASGTYFVTSYVEYGPKCPASGQQIQETFVIDAASSTAQVAGACGGDLTASIDESCSGDLTLHGTASFSAVGTALQFEASCWGGNGSGGLAYTYTATPNVLTLIQADEAINNTRCTVVQVLTKQ